VAVAKVAEYKPRTMWRARAGGIRAVHGRHRDTEDSWIIVNCGGKRMGGWKEVNVVKTLNRGGVDSRIFAAGDSYRETRALAGCNK
jgi:hypothetical protein